MATELLSDARLRALAQALAELVGDPKELTREEHLERMKVAAAHPGLHRLANRIHAARNARLETGTAKPRPTLVWSRD